MRRATGTVRRTTTAKAITSTGTSSAMRRYYPSGNTLNCMGADPQRLGRGISIGDHMVLTGSCSWADRTLANDADWYPRRTMSAEERLRYYAGQFPLTEVDSTYY